MSYSDKKGNQMYGDGRQKMYSAKELATHKSRVSKARAIFKGDFDVQKHVLSRGARRRFENHEI